MGLFDSLLDLADSTVKIIAAPVDVVVTVAAEALKPVAEVVEELAEDIGFPDFPVDGALCRATND